MCIRDRYQGYDTNKWIVSRRIFPIKGIKQGDHLNPLTIIIMDRLLKNIKQKASNLQIGCENPISCKFGQFIIYCTLIREPGRTCSN